MNISFTKIGRVLFYVFAFLLPLFYIPNSVVPIELNKTMFLLSFLSIIAIFAILGIIKEGKFRVKNRFVSFGVLLFLLFTVFSTIFLSINPLNSFLGESGSSDSLIAFLMYGGLFFLPIVLIKNKEQIRNIGVLLVLSIAILNVGFLGKCALGGEIYLALGSVNILAVLNVIGLIMFFFLFKEEKDPSIKGLLGLSLFVLVAGLILINFDTAWFVLAVASFLAFWALLLSQNFKKHNFVLLLVTLVSVFLFLTNPTLPFEKKETVQALGFSESFEIAKNSSFLGSGIASFDENFIKYNPTMLQDTIHYESFSVIFHILNDFGILGLILFLIPTLYLVINGFVRFLRKKQDIYERMSFISYLSLFILLFFYSLDVVLMSLFFLCMSLFLICSEKGKQVCFKNKNSNVVFLNVAAFSLTLIMAVVLNYFYVLNYLSENYYELAIENHKEDRAQAIEYLEKSSSFIEKEKTLIGLSQLYLLNASDLYNESRLLETKEEDREIKKEKCEEFMQLSEEKAIKATEISSQDYSAWINLGNIYNNRRYLRDEELADKALEAYKRAAELAPFTKDPYIALIQVYSELGNVDKREEFLEKIKVIDPNYL